MKILITGSQGLVGSTASLYFLEKKCEVIGIDNNMRAVFFGKKASTSSHLKKLSLNKNYTHYSFDIRDYEKIEKIFKKHKFDAIIHTAAQPSHDKAKDIPMIDFEVNVICYHI